MPSVVMTTEDVRLLIGRTEPFASTEDSRPILMGAKLDLAPGRVIAAAADGFMLGVQTAPATIEEPGEGVVVNLADWRFLARLLPHTKSYSPLRVRLSWQGAKAFRLEIFTPGEPAQPAKKRNAAELARGLTDRPASDATPDHIETAYECWPVQGSYPNYVSLIPEWDGHDSLGAAAVSSFLMARVLKAWNAGKAHTSGIMRWHFKNPASPVVLTESSDEYGFVAVVMPMWVELGSEIGTAQVTTKHPGTGEVETRPAKIPEYDHKGAQQMHKAILGKVLPPAQEALPAPRTRPSKATKPTRKPAASKVNQPARKRAAK